MRRALLCFLVLLSWPVAAAEKRFDFGAARAGAIPDGFRAALGGSGKPGEWKVLLEDAPSEMRTINPGAPSVSKRPVLAQVSSDPTDERFPLLIYEPETFGDFRFSTQFKTVGGAVERMAGIAFRIQDETNYYVLRASSLGNTFRFYKVVNGERGSIIGPEIPIPSGVWHELAVECKGSKIRCLLNGQAVIPELNDNTFLAGRIGFWTKSDSISHFADARILYTPREVPAQVLVRELLKKYSRLLNLEVYVKNAGTNTVRLVASKQETDLGKAGGQTEQDILAQGDVYYGKAKDSVSVAMPVRDRNGDPVAVVRVVMKSFSGQTEQNAIVRATPVVKEIQARVQDVKDLVE